MLQIYIFGPTQEGFLDIDPATVLQMESLMEAFDDDLSTGEFSLPVDLPWTDTNRRLMGFAERLENFSKKEKSWKIIVYDSGFPELPNAKLTILEKSGSFTYARGKFSASVSGNKGLFGSLVTNKTLRDLILGGPITWTGLTSAVFAEQVMKGLWPQYNYLNFATVAIEGFFDTGRPDFTDEFLVQDRINNIVNSGGSTDDWVFSNPAGSEGLLRTVPFFNLKYVLKKVFSENGYTISGDFLNDPDFDYLVIFNQYAIENYSPAGVDKNLQITPLNHMPNTLIKDFLANLFAMFNLYPDFSGGVNEVQLFYKKRKITERLTLSLNELCNKNFTSQFDDNNQTNGYKIEYNFDSADSFPGDRIKEDITKDKTLVATVAKFSDLDTLSIGRPLTTDDIAFVEADNFYYQIADATSIPLKWDAFAERMDGYKVGNGDNSIPMEISTLLTYVEFNPDAALYFKSDCVGCRQLGSYINSKGVRVLNDFGLRVFYIKKLLRTGAMVPTSFSYNRDENNEPIVKYSLAWQGTDGLGINFHKEWQDMQQNREVVKTSITCNQKVLQDLNNNNSVEINGVVFLPYKIKRTIPLKSSMEISLVPL